MPKDLQQHSTVHEAYLRFYKKQETMFQANGIKFKNQQMTGSFMSNPTESFNNTSFDESGGPPKLRELQPTKSMITKLNDDEHYKKPLSEQERLNKSLISSRDILP